MINDKTGSGAEANDKDQCAGRRDGSNSDQTKLSMSKSMHDGVEVWCDCCSCEAEPYWLEAMAGDQDTDE